MNPIEKLSAISVGPFWQDIGHESMTNMGLLSRTSELIGLDCNASLDVSHDCLQEIHPTGRVMVMACPLFLRLSRPSSAHFPLPVGKKSAQSWRCIKWLIYLQIQMLRWQGSLIDQQFLRQRFLLFRLFMRF